MFSPLSPKAERSTSKGTAVRSRFGSVLGSRQEEQPDAEYGTRSPSSSPLRKPVSHQLERASQPAPQFARLRPQNISQETIYMLDELARSKQRSRLGRTTVVPPNRVRHLEERIQSQAKIISQLRAEVLELEEINALNERALVAEKHARTNERLAAAEEIQQLKAKHEEELSYLLRQLVPKSSAKPVSGDSSLEQHSRKALRTVSQRRSEDKDTQQEREAHLVKSRAEEVDRTDGFIRRHFSMDKLDEEAARLQQGQKEQLERHRKKRRGMKSSRSHGSLLKQSSSQIRFETVGDNLSVKSSVFSSDSLNKTPEEEFHFAGDDASDEDYGQPDPLLNQPPNQHVSNSTLISSPDISEDEEENSGRRKAAAPPSTVAQRGSPMAMDDVSPEKVQMDRANASPASGKAHPADNFIKKHFSMDSLAEANAIQQGTQQQLEEHRRKRRSGRRSQKLNLKTNVSETGKITIASAEPADSEPAESGIKVIVQEAVDSQGLTDILRNKPQTGTVVAVSGGSSAAGASQKGDGDANTHADVSDFVNDEAD